MSLPDARLSDVHPTAIVSPHARIGAGSVIGPYCIIHDDVVMGERTVLDSHVVIKNGVTAGDDNVVMPFTVLGGPPADKKWKGGVLKLRIGSRNRILEHVTMHTGTEVGGGVTAIGDDNLLMMEVHLAHDTIVRNKVVITGRTGVAGHVVIYDHAVVGANVIVGQYVHIGECAYATALVVLSRSLPPFAIVAKDGVHVRGPNVIGMRRYGLKRAEREAVVVALEAVLGRNVTDDVLALATRYPAVKLVTDFVANLPKDAAPLALPA